MGNIPALKAALADPHSHAKIKAAFNSYDLGRNGYLTRAEFGTFATNLLTIIETGPNGAQMRAALDGKTPSEFASDMFYVADVDKSGTISFDEFEKFVQARSSIK